MSQKGLAPILIILILAATLVGGYLVYQKQNTKEVKLQRDLSSQFNPNNASGFQIEAKKVLGDFATGVAGIPPQGLAWIAIKENGRWKKIWDGVNSPSCSIMNQYNIPKEIYGTCSTNY